MVSASIVQPTVLPVLMKEHALVQIIFTTLFLLYILMHYEFLCALCYMQKFVLVLVVHYSGMIEM